MMAFNDADRGQQGGSKLEWAISIVRKNRINGTDDGVEGRRPVVQQPPSPPSPRGHFYDPIWTENTSPNDRSQYQRGSNDHHGYQNRFEKDHNQRRDYDGRQNVRGGRFSGSTYRNANRGGHRQATYNNNRNTQAWGKPKYVPPSASYTEWRRSKRTRAAPYTKRPSDRDVQSQSSSGEQSDDSEKQDYMNDLMQYVKRRYELPDNSRLQSKPLRRSSYERDNRSRRSSSERDNRSRRSSSERDSRSRRSSSERDSRSRRSSPERNSRSRRSSSERDSRSRRSSPERNNRSRRSSAERVSKSKRSSSERDDRSSKKSCFKTSGWDKKPGTSSKSRTSTTAHSVSKNEPPADKSPSSHTRQTNINRSASTSNVPEPTNSSSVKSRQSNAQPTITTQSTDISSTSIVPETNDVSIHLTKIQLMEVSTILTSTTAIEVPSSDTQPTSINLSTSTSNVPENANQSNVDESIVASLSTTIATQSASIIPEPSNILSPSVEIEPMELSQTLKSSGNETSNNVLPSLDSNQPMNSNKPSPIVIDLTIGDDVESSTNSRFDKVATSSTSDSSATLNAVETKPSDLPRSSPSPTVIVISDLDDDYSTTSTLETNDKPTTTNMPLIGQEYTSPSKNAPPAIHNFEVPVKLSDKINRKRSLDTSTATESGRQNSSATMNNTQQSDVDELPAKKSMQRTSVPTTTSEESSRSEKSAVTIEHTEEQNNNVIVKAIVPTNSNSNPDQSNSVDPIVATTTTSKDVPNKPVKSVDNEIVSGKTESKVDFNRKEIDKKPKKFSVDKKESKPIIFQKNQIEQFKIILKIAKARSSSWSLSHSSDVNVDNFCDAMHHFEKQSDKICAVTEVKFFDDIGKTNKINYKNLFGDEFNIQRYFATFFKFERSCFNNKYSKFVIMTNREIDIALFYNNGISVSCDNDCYSLKMRQPYDESKIYKKCLECFVLPKLAELLCEFVRSDRKIPHFNMELIRKYHLALVKEKVLQIVEDTKNRDRVAKFHPHFIEGIELSNAAIELRCHLERILRGLPTESMKFRVGNKDFGEDVSSMRYGGTVDKLPDENCKATFEHFFKVFVIVKITKLSDQTIERELGEKFLKLDEPTYFNAVKEELLIILKDCGLKSDILESLKPVISKLEVMEKISQRPHHNIDIEFEQETFANLMRAITTEDVTLCSTDSLLLSELKMRQLSNQESLIVTEKILFEMTDDIVSAFSHRSTNILVIVWEENVVTDSRRIDEIIEKIREITNKSEGKKKCIIIADKCNVNLSSPRYQIFKIDDDLTFKSPNDRFKSTKVSLQGRTLQLSDLADNAAINSLIKNPKIFEKLLIEAVKIGCALSKPAGFKEKLYDFKLKQRVIINPNIFQEKVDDVFLISNIDCENFSLEFKPSDRVIHLSNTQLKTMDLPMNARYFIVDKNVNPKSIRNKIKDKNVHHLSYESNNFIWKSTSGSSAALLKYKIINDEDDCVSPYTIEDILIFGPKTIIVSGESGIGKSVCLYDFATYVNKSYELVWIIQVDLNQPLKHTLKGYPIKTSENAIHFLADYLDLKEEQKELFIMSAQGQLNIKLMLFVDGYDDLYENVDLMTNLLQNLQKSKIERIFVTSSTDKLENLLGTFSYSLKFDNEEKFQFADKFCNDNDFKHNLASKSKLLNTPLHLKMYIEVCQRKPEKSCIDNLYDLYKSYVNLHLSSSNSESAYKLSAQKLLTKNELEEIGVAIENIDLELPEELSRKTIMEYFTAKWLSKRHLNTKKYIDNLIERTSSVFLNVYLAAYKAHKKKKISINEYAEHGFLRSLKEILELDSTNKPCLRRLIRKGKNSTKEVLQFLLEHYNDTGCCEFIQHIKYVDSNLVKYVNQPIKGQTPLQIAAEKNKADLACELMLKGADISVLPSSSSFIPSMATYATKELTNGNTRLGPVAAILLEKSPQTTAHLNVETEFPKVLAYLFSRGYADLIEKLLQARNSEDRCKLLETKVNGKSLLDHVNESEIINDAERYKLILYLSNNLNDTNFLRFNIDSIIRSACIYGHEQTFNYFIESPAHKKTSIDVLHEALRSNDEKIINFLMRDSKRTRDSDGNNALHQAIILGVCRKTMNYLLGKVGINDINDEGETVLHLAFKEGANLSTIKFLIDAGASLTATNELGFYPWIVAIKEESSRYCKEQQRELMKYLLTKNIRFPEGKNPNHTFDSTRKECLPKLVYFENMDDYNLDYDDNGVSRLHAALPCSDEKNWCIFLINHGADVNIVKDGKSAFSLALEYKRYDVAKLMLQHGAIIDMTDKTGKTPLNCLKSDDLHCQTMQKILSLANKILTERKELDAIKSVDSSIIDNSYFRYLLNCRNKYGITLLHVAACIGDEKIIDSLYRFSKECQCRYKDFVPMDVNAFDNHGNTPLHLAVKKNHEECVAKLLSFGARFRATNSEGNKPMDLSYSGSSVRKWLQAAEDLFKLVEQKRVEDVRKLLKTYPDVQNARNDFGKTPLHLARDEKITKLLLANKYADVNALDGEKKPPIYYAAEENYLDGVKLLLKAGANYDFKGIKNGSNESFKLLQKINELFDDIHSHEPRFFVKGNHWALNKQLDDIANTFGITRDVIVNVRDNHRSSLLHYAAKYDYVDVTENLLKNGAIYNSRNKYGKTPMDLAINSKRVLKSVDDLFKNLDVNASTKIDPTIAVNCRMSGGFTLLHKAMEAGNSELYNWLVERGADVRATTNNSAGIRFSNQAKILNLP